MREIVDAANPEEGVRKAIRRYLNGTEDMSLGSIIFVSEQGFAEKFHPKDLFIETEFVLKEMGLFNDFEVEKPRKSKNKKK